jgi:hypothetical protein
MALGRTAKYYKENPEARKRHQDYQKTYQKSPDQVAKRVELNKYNRQHGTYGNGDGKDAAHHNGVITGYKKASANRGSKNDSAGDRRARGSKKK